MDRMMEQALLAELGGEARVAGVDEVGRGPLAGPVLAAAVVLPADERWVGRWLGLVRDSKVLKAARREALAAEICEHACVGVGEASVAEIDAVNIRNATFLAMRRALAVLPGTVQGVVVDGNARIPDLSIRQTTLVQGDAKELAVACASVVAKVARDALMVKLGKDYPAYGWASNAGYGTAAHLAALAHFGPTPAHRTSFAPVAACLPGRAA
jgi:ribonuclease HII